MENGTARPYDGAGLGLALTRKIAELQGDAIKAQSEVGKGSTFIVTLALVGRKVNQ